MCLLVIQNCPNNVYVFAAVACRPQSNNKKSDFPHKCFHAAKIISDKHSNANFAGLSANGVLLETTDLVAAQLSFMDRMRNCTTSTDNKHNIKNDWYHFASGGNSTAIIDNCVIDGDLLRESEMSKDLICLRDFASDEKVEEVFGCKTMKKAFNSLAEGTAISSIRDTAMLFTAVYWAELYLFLVNIQEMPTVQRCAQLHLTLV